MVRLTVKQRQCLELFDQYPASWWTVGELADQLHTSDQGAVYTASSLVRRGMVERARIGGRVHFSRPNAARQPADRG